MLVYLYDESTKEFLGTYDAQESPLEPGVYIVPEASTENPAPAFSPEIQTCKFNGESWDLADIPPLPEPPIEPINPDTLTLSPRQIRLVLNAAGLRTVVENAVAAADQNTKDMWAYSSIFLRTDPILNTMATGLGIPSAQLDSLFEQGQSL